MRAAWDLCFIYDTVLCCGLDMLGTPHLFIRIIANKDKKKDGLVSNPRRNMIGDNQFEGGQQKNRGSAAASQHHYYLISGARLKVWVWKSQRAKSGGAG